MRYCQRGLAQLPAPGIPHPSTLSSQGISYSITAAPSQLLVYQRPWRLLSIYYSCLAALILISWSAPVTAVANKEPIPAPLPLPAREDQDTCKYTLDQASLSQEQYQLVLQPTLQQNHFGHHQQNDNTQKNSYFECQYLLPTPGPHLLILLNLSRRQGHNTGYSGRNTSGRTNTTKAETTSIATTPAAQTFRGATASFSHTRAAAIAPVSDKKGENKGQPETKSPGVGGTGQWGSPPSQHVGDGVVMRVGSASRGKLHQPEGDSRKTQHSQHRHHHPAAIFPHPPSKTYSSRSSNQQLTSTSVPLPIPKNDLYNSSQKPPLKGGIDNISRQGEPSWSPFSSLFKSIHNSSPFTLEHLPSENVPLSRNNSTATDRNPHSLPGSTGLTSSDPNTANHGSPGLDGPVTLLPTSRFGQFPNLQNKGILDALGVKGASETTTVANLSVDLQHSKNVHFEDFPLPSNLSLPSFSNASKKTKEDESESEDWNTYRPNECIVKLIVQETDDRVPRLAQQDAQKSQTGAQIFCWQGKENLEIRFSASVRVIFRWSNDNIPDLITGQIGYQSIKEVGCQFNCSSAQHLCLLQHQLCDGHSDCPDHSDEATRICHQAHVGTSLTEKERKAPSIILVGVILPCAFIGAVFVIVILLMIRQKQTRLSPRRSGDALLDPTSSTASEVCRSVQEHGQSEALLPDHPPPYSQSPSGQLYHPQQQHQHQYLQHQHVLTYTGSGVVSSLHPTLLPQPHHQYSSTLQQQIQQQHPPLYHQLNHCCSNSNNNKDCCEHNDNAVSNGNSSQGQQHKCHHQVRPVMSCPDCVDTSRCEQSNSSSLGMVGYCSATAQTASSDVEGFQHSVCNNFSGDDNRHVPQSHSQHPPNISQGQQHDNHYHQNNHIQHQQHHQQHRRHFNSSSSSSPSHPPASLPTVSASTYTPYSMNQHPSLTAASHTVSLPSTSSPPPPQYPQSCPPQIPLSQDGEEGYAVSQRSLMSYQRQQEELAMFQPPPNRSALDRDSPPPPYTQHSAGAGVSGGFSLDSLLGSCQAHLSRAVGGGKTTGGRSRGKGATGGGGHLQTSSGSYPCTASANTAPSSGH